MLEDSGWAAICGNHKGAVMRYIAGINFDRGSHGRGWCALPGREPRAFRAGSKRAAGAALALRECGVSDIEAAAAFLGRAPENARERLRAHVEYCEAQMAYAGYAGAFARARVGDYLAAVEIMAGKDAAKAAREALKGLPADGTIWILFLWPGLTSAAEVSAVLEQRLAAIAAAGRKAATKRKAPAKRKTGAKRKAARRAK